MTERNVFNVQTVRIDIRVHANDVGEAREKLARLLRRGLTNGSFQFVEVDDA